jgi:hypothetical protein
MPTFRGPSLAYSLARMEESCHGRANGSDSATTGSCHHRREWKNGTDRQYSSTIPTYSYVGVQGTTHNLELWVVLATMIGPMAGARSIISSPALGIMIKINMPKLRKTIVKRTLPYFTFIGWVRELQSTSSLVRISTRSTDQYRPVEYPKLTTARSLLKSTQVGFLVG